jgi:uncharacterized membrane-anchored protein
VTIKIKYQHMKKAIFIFIFLVSWAAYSQEIDSMQLTIDAVEKSLEYKTGTIDLESGNVKINVPEGFRYLDRQQSIYVYSELWGNPADSSMLGMLVPVDKGVLAASGWAFTIVYDEMGYVKDDDADDIDYDDLLKEQQKEIKDANPSREAQGYPPIEFIGWASTPFYDQDKKVLHWAKELKFGTDSLNTLNYNLRVLGRKGVLIVNAIATMSELPEVKSNIGKVIASIQYNEGSRYADFDSKIDNVAAWTVGGLVAGKVLAKVGFFAILAKFGKVIFIAVAAGGAAIWKFIRGRRREDDFPVKSSSTDNTKA